VPFLQARADVSKERESLFVSFIDKCVAKPGQTPPAAVELVKELLASKLEVSQPTVSRACSPGAEQLLGLFARNWPQLQTSSVRFPSQWELDLSCGCAG
jgi:hypothetical protein